MIADLQKVSATLQSWEVEPAPANLKPPVLPAEKPQLRWNWSRLVVGLGASLAAVLLIAAISIPNLLRSRMSVQTARQNAGEPSPLNLPSDALGKGEGSGGPVGFRGGSNDEDVSGIIGPNTAPATIGRLIAYQVSMMIEVKEFDPAKQKLLQVVEQAGGYVAQASTAETPNQPRSASLTVRVPADKLSAVLQQLRGLGRVRQDQLSTEEVTEQVVDLEARLKNARSTEQRLIDVLNNRTGKVGDILQVEQEISRTREGIERMEAQRQNLMRRVEMATVNVTLAEEFKAQLETTPVGTGARLWNALVDGYESFVGTILGMVFFLARYGLSLIFWSGVCWMGWRLARPRVKRLLAQAGIAS